MSMAIEAPTKAKSTGDASFSTLSSDIEVGRGGTVATSDSFLFLFFFFLSR